MRPRMTAFRGIPSPLASPRSQIPRSRTSPTLLYPSPIQPISPLSRTYSTAPSGQSPEPPSQSPHSQFYKTFTRPVAKVLLLATFTYQLLYFGWVKFEQQEEREQKQALIQGLEEQLQTLQREKKE